MTGTVLCPAYGIVYTPSSPHGPLVGVHHDRATIRRPRAKMGGLSVALALGDEGTYRADLFDDDERARVLASWRTCRCRCHTCLLCAHRHRRCWRLS